ncbi:hypothetical protein GCM10027612_74730 [Microbispora bryophytorum subsp. camponoti]
MAPEQWSGGKAGPASDVYAATVVFFECLTGGRPFRAQNMAALARQHQATPPPVDEVPPPLRDLVERGMAKRPEERFASAEEFVRELEIVAAGAYGPAWEERGRRRLAALAGLLVPFFPLKENVSETGTALAETKLSGLLSRTRMKIGLTLAGMVVIAGGTVALVQTMSGGTTLQAGTTIATPPAVDPSSIEVEDDSGDDPTEDPEDATPAPANPTPAGTSPAATSPEPNPSPTSVVQPSATGRATPGPTPRRARSRSPRRPSGAPPGRGPRPSPCPPKTRSRSTHAATRRRPRGPAPPRPAGRPRPAPRHSPPRAPRGSPPPAPRQSPRRRSSRPGRRRRPAPPTASRR